MLQTSDASLLFKKETRGYMLKLDIQLFGGRGASSTSFSGVGNATRSGASDDWFEYENANVMAEFIQTGVMPTADMNGRVLSMEERQRLAHEANLMQEEGAKTNTGQKTLYRGVVMSEEEARALTPGEIYTTKTLTAATPDRKVASVYSDVENYGGGEGVSVIFEMQKPDGIRGFKRDNTETVLPKGSSFRIAKNFMDEKGVVHVSLYSKKGNNVK